MIMEVAVMAPDPAGLAPRGRQLWADVLAEGTLTAGQMVLLEEGCRIADRLQILDELVEENRAHYAEMLKFMAEARQQSGVLRSLLADLRRNAPASETSSAEVVGVSDLSARIAERRREASG
jgi:hypothetical protein